MKRIIYLLLPIVMACSTSTDVGDVGVLVPGIPDSIPSVPDELRLDSRRFTHSVKIEYSDNNVHVSELPQGVDVAVEGANVVASSSVGGVEFVLSGKSGNGSFCLSADEETLITLSSLMLFSQKGNTIDVKAPSGVFVRSVGDTPSYIMDGIPGDTVAVPKNVAAIRLQGNAVFCSGKLAVRGERMSAIHCTGRMIADNMTLAVEDARTDAIAADSGVVVLGGKINVKAAKDAVKSKKGNVVVLGGNLMLETRGEKGDAVQARNFYQYAGNITANVTGNAGRGINSKGAVYLCGGLLQVVTDGNAIYSEKKNDYTSAACIKSETHTYIGNAHVSLTNNGGGGKGINCNGLFQMDNGTLVVNNNGSGVQHPTQRDARTSAKGVKCDSSMLVRGGLIDIRVLGKGEGTEGVEAKCDMIIAGKDATIYVYAYDDAMNVGRNMTVDDGRIYAYSVANDGVDCNGTLCMNGGLVVANGCGSPEQGVDVDFDSRFSVNGGTLLSVGGTMGPHPVLPRGENSSTPVIAWTSEGLERGKILAVANAGGEILYAYRLPRMLPGGAFLFCSPMLKRGGEYSLLYGDSITSALHLGNGVYVGGTVVGKPVAQWRQDDIAAIVDASGNSRFMGVNVGGQQEMMPPPPPSHEGNGAFPPPPHDGNGAFPPPPHEGNGAFPPPPHEGNGAFPPPPPPNAAVYDDGYGKDILPGGGWLPVSIR